MTKKIEIDINRNLAFCILLYIKTDRPIVKTPKSNPSKIRGPPAFQASGTGCMEIKTVASPPSPTNPIMPTLSSPAIPH